MMYSIFDRSARWKGQDSARERCLARPGQAWRDDASSGFKVQFWSLDGWFEVRILFLDFNFIVL